MSILCFEIEQIPDLSLNKYQSLADVGIEGVLKRHESFLRQWHGICAETTLSIHLLYCYLPSEVAGKRLKVYFLIQGKQDDLGMVEPLVKKSPLSDFFELKRSVVPQVSLSVGAVLTKKELMAKINNPMTAQNKLVHYVPNLEMNEQGRLYDLFRIMETIGEAYFPKNACGFRVDLYSAYMVEDTRSKFMPVLKELHGENDIRLMRETDSIQSNDYARDICKEHEDWVANIETTPHFRMNVYSFADSVFKAKMILNAVCAEAISEGELSVTSPIKADSDGAFSFLSRMGMEPRDYCQFINHPATVLSSWSTTYCLSEVVPFFRFPTLYDGESIGIPKETAPVQFPNGVFLGKDTNGYPVNIALEDLPRHAFFTGMPGSGKTNTMLHLVTQLHKKGIPFLALESAKKEYRALLGYQEMQDIYLFSPHLQSKFPLQINPMAFPVGVRLSEHINALLEVFEGSFPLEGPTYKFLSSAIQQSYIDLGWEIEDENTEDCEVLYPTMQDVYDNLEKEINASDYDGELKGNIHSFLQVRLGGLMERDAGELFNVRMSTIKPEEWLNVSAIVELEVLSKQAKNFFVLLVSHYILETLRANPSGGRGCDGKIMPVRHVVFIEEAHNIIASSTQQAGSDFVDPKIAATAYIVKMLAEVRALREAIIIADQLPTALACEVTKNTGLKLVHRLTAQDDREQIGTAIAASPMQLERMASFNKGQAFIYHEKTIKPFEMQVAEWIRPEVEFDVSSDLQLYSEMWLKPTMIHATRVAFQNWIEKYCVPTDEQEKELIQQYRENDGTDQKAIQKYADEKDELLRTYKRLYNQCIRFGKLWICSTTGEHPLQEKMDNVMLYIDEMVGELECICGELQEET